MALDFPNSPTDGQTFSSGSVTWTYSTANAVWTCSQSAAGTAYQATAPTGALGMTWVDSDTNALYVYNGSAWVLLPGIEAKVPTITTNNYTMILSDQGRMLEMNNGATANTLTIPLNSSVAYPVGTTITIVQTGTGQTTVTATGGVTLNASPGAKLRTQWSTATLVKRATDTWLLFGDVIA